MGFFRLIMSNVRFARDAQKRFLRSVKEKNVWFVRNAQKGSFCCASRFVRRGGNHSSSGVFI